MPSAEGQPKAVPSFQFPPSSSTVSVRVIDSTTRLQINPDIFWRPKAEGLNPFEAPVFCFLVSHGHEHVLFDLGVRRDWENYAPTTVKLIKATTTVQTQKNISDILDADTSGLGIKSAHISAIIWSHHHFDHVGDPSTFPPSTALVVGPGFRQHHQPAYPTDPSSPILDSDTAGRPIHEINFRERGKPGLHIGRFPALDYFGDGSFYLLDAPGHAVGHICGLARVTSAPDSFVFMGADACHHPGLLRPSQYVPLPCSITPPHLLPATTEDEQLRARQDSSSNNKPFFTPSKMAFPAQADARETLRKISELDARDDVFVILAHDTSLEGQIDLYPRSINGWMEKGWKARTRWLFCKDFAG
ncbi:MAG: hypothetical protein LQ345_006438 [Seirophora villosa]|nr:MAG: hypothetical protein LQ345_006438 [Seirophora villosa]